MDLGLTGRRAAVAAASAGLGYASAQSLADEGILQVRHKLPSSDLTSLTAVERQLYMDDEQPLEFSHTWETQIGGQLAAGFLLAGFYEDTWAGRTLSEYIAEFFATRAVKLS